MSKIITIGREYGSGGREIGYLLAEKLGIPFYDKEIISLAAEAGGLSHALIEANEEGLHHLNGRPGRMQFASFRYTPSFSDSIYLHQAEVIRQLAKQGPAVFVGRLADFVLKDEDILKVFIYADMPYKIARKRAMAPEKADFTDEQMAKAIRKVDRARKRYYEQYSGCKWGDPRRYELCLRSDAMSEEAAVDVIMKALEV